MIPESIQPYFVLGLIFLMFLVIYKELINPSKSFLLAVAILLITGILTTKEILAGFSNEKIATIIVLILITSGIRKNFQIEFFFDMIFKAAKSYRGYLIRMMAQTALFSAFINNTPIVALMTPYVIDWGKNNGVAPSKLLIPLSYATIMGGMITIIGTSTTLVLNGFMEEHGIPTMKFSDLLIIGLCVTVSGILFIGLFAHRFLPENKDLLRKYSENIREYVVETRIEKKSKLIGKSVAEGELRNLKGVYLVEIVRNNRVISPVDPGQVLMEGDALIFAGNTNDIVDLINKDQGLTLPNTAQGLEVDKTEVMEAVLSPFSSIIGKTVKESQFRNRYNAAIIAVHRNGERVTGKIGDIQLQAGDVLLVYAGEDFKNRAEVYRDIYTFSSLRKINKPGVKKYYALAAILAATVILLTIGQLSLFLTLLVIITAMAAFNLIDVQDVKRELDINLIIILVFSLALGDAMLKTGAGQLIAEVIIDSLDSFGKIAILLGLFVFTNLLTSIITNVGAVSIAFPIAYSISQSQGIDGTPFYLAIGYAASAAFLTPIGYQTNLIVYGPGGYNFKDFFRIGLPVNIIYLVVSLLAIMLLYRDSLL